ncbi:uncharacterized protein O3C94_015222 [Discoglossus pictus]
MMLVFLLLSVLLSVSAGPYENEWIDPTDMMNYDMVNKRMTNSQKMIQSHTTFKHHLKMILEEAPKDLLDNKIQKFLEDEDWDLVGLEKNLQEIHHFIHQMVQSHTTFKHHLKMILQKTQKDLPDKEIQKFLQDEDWEPVGLVKNLQEIHHFIHQVVQSHTIFKQQMKIICLKAQKLGLPDTEIQKFLKDEVWDPVALEKNLQEIHQFMHHNDVLNTAFIFVLIVMLVTERWIQIPCCVQLCYVGYHVLVIYNRFRIPGTEVLWAVFQQSELGQRSLALPPDVLIYLTHVLLVAYLWGLFYILLNFLTWLFSKPWRRHPHPKIVEKAEEPGEVQDLGAEDKVHGQGEHPLHNEEVQRPEEETKPLSIRSPVNGETTQTIVSCESTGRDSENTTSSEERPLPDKEPEAQLRHTSGEDGVCSVAHDTQEAQGPLNPTMDTESLIIECPTYVETTQTIVSCESTEKDYVNTMSSEEQPLPDKEPKAQLENRFGEDGVCSVSGDTQEDQGPQNLTMDTGSLIIESPTHEETTPPIVFCESAVRDSGNTTSSEEGPFPDTLSMSSYGSIVGEFENIKRLEEEEEFKTQLGLRSGEDGGWTSAGYSLHQEPQSQAKYLTFLENVDIYTDEPSLGGLSSGSLSFEILETEKGQE